MRQEAEDDYLIVEVDNKEYLVNDNGKIQKSTSGKKITEGKIEDTNFSEDVFVKTDSKGAIKGIYPTSADAKAETNAITNYTPAEPAYLGWED